MNSSSMTSKFAAALFAAGMSFGLGLAGTASARVTDDLCGEGGAQCKFTMGFDGQQVGGGTFSVGEDGTISLPKATTVNLANGVSVGVGNISGNADPILGFNASANGGTTGGTFTFNFFLPISLNGPINSHGEIGYSLTATTTDGAQVAPFLTPKVLSGREVDTSVGGKPPLDKHVDAGDTFFFTGVGTQQSITYKTDGALVVDPAYDQMSATVAFSLSPNSNVGISGLMSQTPVPEPSTYALLAAGLAFVGFIGRRRLNA
jgi:hypothetical protein